MKIKECARNVEGNLTSFYEFFMRAKCSNFIVAIHSLNFFHSAFQPKFSTEQEDPNWKIFHRK